MRFPIKTTIFLLILAGAGVAGFMYLPDYWKKLHKVNYRQAEVTRGSILSTVNATGTVKPVLSISVGSFVSGPIEGLYVDFNDAVNKGQLLAKIDPRLYEANVARDRALLATKKADLERVKALLQQAKNDYGRAVALRKENRDFISDAEMDQFKFAMMSLEAQLVVAEAFVEQAEASLENSKANLEYTEIRSPVDGIVIERKIDQGQTLAAQFQTPELFIVAPDLKTMHIHATVDEADIGLIAEAKRKRLPVRFTVDAYPNDLFTGQIYQIRKNSTTTQNVVTYPVIILADNPALWLAPGTANFQSHMTAAVMGLFGPPLAPPPMLAPLSLHPEFKLKPGQTANLTFEVDEVKDVLRIPNAALRFYPHRQQVHPDDRAILDGTEKDSEANDSAQKLTAREKAEARQKRNRRHVWYVDGDFLRAVEVVTGLSDNKYTQVISGDLKEGQMLVTGIQIPN